MRLIYAAVPETLAEEVRRTLRSPQYGHPAHRELASGYGPCRHCLRQFDAGAEDRLLVTYQPFPEGALPNPGPIYLHPEPCRRYEADTPPPGLEACR